MIQSTSTHRHERWDGQYSQTIENAKFQAKTASQWKFLETSARNSKHQSTSYFQLYGEANTF